MAKWMDHEILAILTLIGDALPKNVIEDILRSDQCDVDYNGHGYYVTVSDNRLPVERSVYHGSSDEYLIGFNENGFDCGYIVFVMDRELTLECHPWGEPLPPEFRESRVEIRVQSN